MNKATRNDLLAKTKVLNLEQLSYSDVKDYPPERIVEIKELPYLLEEVENEDIKIRLLAKQTLHLKTIKNIVIFFLVMWLTGVTIGLVYIVKFATELNAIW